MVLLFKESIWKQFHLSSSFEKEMELSLGGILGRSPFERFHTTLHWKHPLHVFLALCTTRYQCQERCQPCTSRGSVPKRAKSRESETTFKSNGPRIKSSMLLSSLKIQYSLKDCTTTHLRTVPSYYEALPASPTSTTKAFPLVPHWSSSNENH